MKVLRGGAALVAVLMVALATVASVNGAPARRGAALSAAHPAASAADSDPLRKYYSPDDALREGVVSGYVTGPRFPWSARPGQTLQFRVSSYSPSYNVQLVRMFNASPDPHGPGVVETPINAPANGRHTGTPHLLDLGSYVSVPECAALARTLHTHRVGRADHHSRLHGQPSRDGELTDRQSAVPGPGYEVVWRHRLRPLPGQRREPCAQAWNSGERGDAFNWQSASPMGAGVPGVEV
jgi:hypothetical protein